MDRDQDEKTDVTPEERSQSNPGTPFSSPLLNEKVRTKDEVHFTRLNRRFAAWRTAEDIRTFAGALRDEAARRSLAIDPKSRFGMWLVELDQYADNLDPINALISALESGDETILL
jgi:hypothetical protein